MVEDVAGVGADRIINVGVRENIKLDVATKKNESSEASVDSLRSSAINQASSESAVLKALSNVRLSITIDESADLPVIKIFDSESGDEIMQVPAEHSLNISRSIKAAVGSIFDKSA